MADEERLRTIQRGLKDVGIELEVRGGLATVRIDGTSFTRTWSWLEDDELSSARQPRGGSEELLLGDRIPPAPAERLRRAGHWFADADGNIYVRGRGVHVDIRGRRRKRDAAGAFRGAPSSRQNLMSSRRARVVFGLLTWPELVLAPVRRVADAVGVSLSVAHDTLTILTEDRYLIPGSPRLDHADDLIDRWLEAFPRGMGRDLELGKFVGEPAPEAWAVSGHRVHVSGEWAAPGRPGAGLTLYVPRLDTRLVMQSRWRRATSTDEHPNIVLRKVFWAGWLPSASPSLPDSAAAHLAVAPPLLVYADLLELKDPRLDGLVQSLRAEGWHGLASR